MAHKPIRTKEEWRRFKTQLATPFLEERRALYERTRNPIHALAAYRFARSAKIDLPGWTLELFDRWAEVLLVKRPKGVKEIAGALGLKGGGGGPSLTSQAETQMRHMQIAQRVYELCDGSTLEEALAATAEQCGFSFEHVRTIWYELTRKASS